MALHRCALGGFRRRSFGSLRVRDRCPRRRRWPFGAHMACMPMRSRPSSAGRQAICSRPHPSSGFLSTEDTPLRALQISRDRQHPVAPILRKVLTHLYRQELRLAGDSSRFHGFSQIFACKCLIRVRGNERSALNHVCAFIMLRTPPSYGHTHPMHPACGEGDMARSARIHADREAEGSLWEAPPRGKEKADLPDGPGPSGCRVIPSRAGFSGDVLTGHGGKRRLGTCHEDEPKMTLSGDSLATITDESTGFPTSSIRRRTGGRPSGRPPPSHETLAQPLCWPRPYQGRSRVIVRTGCQHAVPPGFVSRERFGLADMVRASGYQPAPRWSGWTGATLLYRMPGSEMGILSIIPILQIAVHQAI